MSRPFDAASNVDCAAADFVAVVGDLVGIDDFAVVVVVVEVDVARLLL